MKKIDAFFNDKKNYAAVFIRLIVGAHLVIGVQDNILSWDRMLEFRDFLNLFEFPVPLVSAILSVYAQFICGVLYLIGWKVRLAAIVMIGNFLVALFMVHLGNDTYVAMFPALVMLSGSLFLLFNGAGKVSIEEWQRD
ncbi:MAG: DoxX family protein [Balneolaceae bacterium]